MTTDASHTTLDIRSTGVYVREIVLKRPEVFNRVDEPLHHELIAVLNDIGNDSTVRAVVLSSTGPAFSAGGDFDMMLDGNRDTTARREIIDTGRKLAATLFALPQPIVAAVQGPAIGLGATIALSCDAVVAARSASLADPHVQLGLVAGDGGCVVWPSAAGMLRARRHLLTGDPLTAEEAHAIGLVTDLVELPEDARDAAVRIAERMAACAPLAVQGTKRALNRVTLQRAGEVLDLSFALEEQTLASEDLVEAVTAFREKRSPDFKGR